MEPEQGMVERGARLLERQAWAVLGTGGDTLAYKNRRTSSLRKSRLFIEAMREPTPAMIGACRFGYSSERLDTWSRMITAALGEDGVKHQAANAEPDERALDEIRTGFREEDFT